MNGSVYGSLRTLPVASDPPAPKPLPVLPGFPDESSPVPRRRRTIVCSNLFIEGEQWDLEEARLKMRDALRGDKADIRCTKRPGVQIKNDYAADVCLSSWCRQCPFIEGGNPKTADRSTLPAPKPPGHTAGDRIRDTIRAMGLSCEKVSLAMGYGASFVQNVVTRNGPPDSLLAIESWLEKERARREQPPLLDRVRLALVSRSISHKLAAHGIGRIERTVAGVINGTRQDAAVVDALAQLLGIPS